LGGLSFGPDVGAAVALEEKAKRLVKSVALVENNILSCEILQDRSSSRGLYTPSLTDLAR
jgi:hypothetical protein